MCHTLIILQFGGLYVWIRNWQININFRRVSMLLRKILKSAEHSNESKYSRMNQVKVFKGFLPQTLLSLFLNTCPKSPLVNKLIRGLLHENCIMAAELKRLFLFFFELPCLLWLESFICTEVSLSFALEDTLWIIKSFIPGKLSESKKKVFHTCFCLAKF